MSFTFLVLSLAWIVAAFMGSIPFGFLISKRVALMRSAENFDIRKEGSGNIGTTNVSRVHGFWPWGAMTLVFDLLKGVLPVLPWMPWSIGFTSEFFGLVELETASTVIAWGAGFFSVFGHCFTPWLGFRGGKGVATGFGALLVLSPWAALVGAAVYGVTFLNVRMGSLGSLVGLVGVGLGHLVFQDLQTPHLFGLGILWIIIIRHSENLDALLEGTERQFR
jgi:glycerol-3-phosphate acyltransferase PlsY